MIKFYTLKFKKLNFTRLALTVPPLVDLSTRPLSDTLSFDI